MLSYDEVYEMLPATGWLTKEEGRLLHSVAASCTGPILEVGSYHGRSAVLLASLGRTVHCVDPFNDFDSDDPSGDFVHSKFMENVFYSRALMNVHLHRMKIEDFTPPETLIPFAYLDGDHTYQGSINQINRARSFGAKNICIHDYAQSGGGVEIVKAIRDTELQVIQIVERMAHCQVK